MQCPQDRTPLVVRPDAATDVGHCATCAGLWLPSRVVARALGHVPRRPRGDGARPHPTRRCPDDGSALYAVHAHGVEVDVCGRCGGVWLDDGELQRIAQLRGRAAGTATQDTTGQAAEAAVDIVSAAGDVVGGVLEFVVEALFSW